ncbi:MAG TPA: rRNA maturation RNase YbeY [Gammaproteobacteria bacterium]|jgi:probable rRNA maturation factor|nr:rRNA maturation RNase YbeY [Gammaproteobacteria bacterium]
MTAISQGLIAEVQIATGEKDLPSAEKIQHWLTTAFPDLENKLVLIRFVDESESAELNLNYRRKHGPTNILSFPLELPDSVPNDQLGDLVICTTVTNKEAAQQQKTTTDHYCHLLIHGVLHLMGYDHLDNQQAEKMEGLEIKLLKRLGISNPYIC